MNKYKSYKIFLKIQIFFFNKFNITFFSKLSDLKKLENLQYKSFIIEISLIKNE